MMVYGSKKILLLVWAMLFMAHPLLAQDEYAQGPDLSNRSLKEVKGMAKNALRLGDTYTALFYYQEWADRKTDNISLAHQVAELLRATRDYEQAELYYSKVRKADEDKYPLSVFYLAQMQMQQEKYLQAQENFDYFRKKIAKKVDAPEYKKLAKSSSLGCTYAIELQDSTLNAAVLHLDTSINRAHIEFSPIILDENHIIYGSLREDSVNYYSIADIDSMNIPLRKFYVAEKIDGEWKNQGELSGPFNQEDKHVGNGAIREDGSRIYFTICEKNWKGKVICELYYSDKSEAGWQPPIRMIDAVNMPGYTTTQPAIGRESKKNRELVYFASDRPDGKGGMDIWYTEYRARKDEWRNPRNAGSKVNTTGTEMTPYYSLASHRLYFSSDGWPGLGGLDVFFSEGEKSKFLPPINLQKDINSSADDLGFTLAQNMKEGFLVSNRTGSVSLLHKTCCDDIYQFTFSKFIDIQLDINALSEGTELEDYEVNVYIKDESNVVTGDFAKPDYLSKQMLVKGKTTSLQLIQGSTYIIEVSKQGYFNDRVEIGTRNINTSDTLAATLNLLPMAEAPTSLPGILYEFNSADLTKEARLAIDTSLYEILLKNPTIVVEIASHTDNKGEKAYNQRLSKQRALSVVNYLSIKGIDRDRLQYEGYGESRPVAENSNADGSDNPEGRRLNRRTEFLVVGSYEREIEEDDEDFENEQSGKDMRF